MEEKVVGNSYDYLHMVIHIDRLSLGQADPAALAKQAADYG
jgi:hypothetical protein